MSRPITHTTPEEVAAIKENKERTMTRKYTIENDQNSVISTHDTYEDAIVAAEAYVGPDGVVGHDGDLSEHGDRTLVWGSEESADNDDGENAIAVIRRV